MSEFTDTLRASGLDPRLTPARADLAADTLRGVVAAARFVPGRAMRVVAPSAGLWRAPRGDRELDTELLQGERFTVYDEREGWAWGQAALDGYVGYVSSDALAPDTGPPETHKVGAVRTLVFPAPDMRITPLHALSREARVTCVGERDGFSRLATGGFAVTRHLAALDGAGPSAAQMALDFLGVPYLWGGRTALGLDCSGLVQIAFAAAGVALPRDSDMQARAPAQEVATADALQSDDLVVWDGHVALMIDAARIIHATIFHGAVAVEPLSEAIARLGPPTALRRVR